MSVDQLTARDRARQLMSNAPKASSPSSQARKSAAPARIIGRGFDTHPGAIELKKNHEGLAKLGVENPYFKAWEKRDGAKVWVDNQWKVNYSSYNYLGLAGDPDIAAAAKQAIDDYGTSVSAARIVSGEIPLYTELEQEFADFYGTEDAMVFISGYLTNVSTLGYLLGEKDLIIHDSLIHNSMVTGALLSGAHRLTFPHNDAEALDRILSIHRKRYERAIVLTEGVFSMDGDVGNVEAVRLVAQKHDASVMVDEAHSLGTLGKTGRGVQEALGVKPDDVDIWMGSLSKSIGSVGGFIAGSKTLIENMRYNAPGAALYCATSPPPSAAAALCGLRKIKTETWRVEKLHENSATFLQAAREHGLETGISEGTPVIPVFVGNTIRSIRVMDHLNNSGINVQAIFYPVVPQNESRLRFFVNTTHTKEDILKTVETIAKVLKQY